MTTGGTAPMKNIMMTIMVNTGTVAGVMTVITTATISWRYSDRLHAP